MRSLLLLFSLVAVSRGFISVDPETSFFVDEHGRARIFHGFNVVYKRSPYIPVLDRFDPALSFSEFDMEQFASWGFNVVRLGAMWPALQPRPDFFNHTHLNLLVNLTRTLYSHGIYSFIDVHQDVLSEKFCGDGVPAWALPPNSSRPFPQPAHDDDMPPDPSTGIPRDCSKYPWPSYYFTHAVAEGFAHLYADADGHFAALWAALARAFADEPQVVGYEILNEPFAGDVFKNPLLLVPGAADRKVLAGFYDRVVAAIRANDNNHVVMFEPVTWDYLRTGFERAPGAVGKQALSYHIYCQPQRLQDEWTRVDRVLCAGEDEDLFAQRVADGKRLGVGLFLTEFGGVGERNGSFDSLRFIAGLADKHMQSWTYWQYKFFNEPCLDTSGDAPLWGVYDASGKFEAEKVDALARPYPRAVAGRPLSYNFDGRTFRLEFATTSASSTQPTEIFVGKRLHFKSGVVVEVEPSNCTSHAYDVGHDTVLVSHADCGPDQRVTVALSPAALGL